MTLNVGNIASRIVVVAEPSTPVTEVAKLMREHHVGALPVIEGQVPKNRAIGIITDRDLVIEVLAAGVEGSQLTAAEVMTADVVTIAEGASVFDAIEAMQRHAVRRLLVTDLEHRLVGIVSMDDVIELLAEEMGKLAGTIKRAQQREDRLRPVR